MNFQSRCVYPALPQPRNAVDDRTFQAGERICIRPNSLTAAIIGGPNPIFTYNRVSILPTDAHSPKWHYINVVKSDGVRFRSLVPFQDIGKYYPVTNESSIRSIARQRGMNAATASGLFTPYLNPMGEASKGLNKRQIAKNAAAAARSKGLGGPAEGGKSRKARRGGKKTRRNSRR